MKEKLESLKNKSKYSSDIQDFIRDFEIPINTWEYIEQKTNTDDSGNLLFLEFDSNNNVKNAYIDAEELNTLPTFYIYFPLDTRWEDILMNNFFIGIKSGSIENALYCLETISPILSKIVYVSERRPTNLKPYTLIKSSYRTQNNVNFKTRNAIIKKVSKIKIIKEIVL